MPYHVTDRAPDRTSADWKRVAAVFVSGAGWQFKGWPHKVRLADGAVMQATNAVHARLRKAHAMLMQAQGAEEGDMALALSSMLGVHVGLRGEVMPENVKRWNLLKVRPACGGAARLLLYCVLHNSG